MIKPKELFCNKKNKGELVLTRREFIVEFARRYDYTQRDAKMVIDDVTDFIMNLLAEGNKINLFGFGTFYVKETAERRGTNPKTHEIIHIPAKKVPAFIPAIPLKRAVAESKIIPINYDEETEN